MRRLRPYLIVLLGAAYVGAMVFAAFTFEHTDALLAIEWADVGLLSLLGLAGLLHSGLLLRIAVRVAGAQIGNIESVGLACANALLDYLPLRAGLGFKAAYLASVHRLPISSFASLTLVTFAIAALCAGVLGVAASLWLLGYSDTGRLSLILMTAAYAAVTAGGVFMILGSGKLHLLPLPIWAKRHVDALSAAILTLSRQRTFQVQALAITLSMLLVIALRLYFVTGLLEVPVSFAEAVLLSTSTSIARLVSFLPAGLGVREAALSATLVAVGGEAEAGIMVAAIDRVVVLVWAAIVGGIWIVSSRRRPGNAVPEEGVKC